jgi:hypothetical protein
MHVAITTSDPQSPGPSLSQVETEETPVNIEGNPDDPEPASEADVQIEFFSD